MNDDVSEQNLRTRSVLCVIPTMGGNLPRLERCIRSVQRVMTPGVKILVVWNSEEKCALPADGYAVYEPGINLGYGPAINVAVARNPSEFIWTAQDDMVFPNCYLPAFIEAMDSDLTLAVITPGRHTSESDVTFRPRGGGISPDGKLVSKAPARQAETLGLVRFDVRDWVPLSGAVIRTSAFALVNGFDLTYFPVGYSDVDLSWRLRAKGFRLASAVNYGAVHDKAGSTPSRLAAYLTKTNGDYFERKVRGLLHSSVEIDVPAEVLSKLAQTATLKILGFASFVDATQIGPRKRLKLMLNVFRPLRQQGRNALLRVLRLSPRTLPKANRVFHEPDRSVDKVEGTI